MISHKSVYILKLGHYLPERRVTNDQIIAARQLKMKASWVETRLGIRERRWANDHQTTSDLGVEALKKIVGPEGPLVLSTISPDYLTPSTASEIKRKMRWQQQHQATDLAAACAGFIFSLEVGALLCQALPEEHIYVLAAELRSRFLDMSDRRTVFLFSDAAGACSLRCDPQNSLAQLLWTSCSTEGLVEPEILIPAGGAKTPMTEELLKSSMNKIKMVDGVSITQAVEEKLVSAVKNCLAQRGESISDYGYFVFHQGNGQLIARIMDQIGASAGQTHTNFSQYGNSSSASVAVALSEASELGLIKSNQKVLLVAMGAGYHLGLAGLRWN
ncbi:MAG: ketoacyl-ACP synthase III [Bdellovibrionales bacterium]|nr:ketoacyl-ACP synthase III [Bdellovibrionales bacterium]